MILADVALISFGTYIEIHPNDFVVICQKKKKEKKKTLHVLFWFTFKNFETTHFLGRLFMYSCTYMTFSKGKCQIHSQALTWRK